MTHIHKKYLEYIVNAEGGYTKESFIDDLDPIGDMVWNDISHLIRIDENGKLFLTKEGLLCINHEVKEATE